MRIGPRDKVFLEDEEMIEIIEAIEQIPDYSDLDDDSIIEIDDFIS